MNKRQWLINTIIVSIVTGLIVFFVCKANYPVFYPDYNEKLLDAARSGDTETVKALIGKGANVNAREPYLGQTALMFISAGGFTGYKCTETVELLIEKGADVNAKSNYGLTALMWASVSGHTDIVKLLIEKGADVNAKDEDGMTALMYASKEGQKIIELLKQAGAKE